MASGKTEAVANVSKLSEGFATVFLSPRLAPDLQHAHTENSAAITATETLTISTRLAERGARCWNEVIANVRAQAEPLMQILSKVVTASRTKAKRLAADRARFGAEVSASGGCTRVSSGSPSTEGGGTSAHRHKYRCQHERTETISASTSNVTAGAQSVFCRHGYLNNAGSSPMPARKHRRLGPSNVSIFPHNAPRHRFSLKQLSTQAL